MRPNRKLRVRLPRRAPRRHLLRRRGRGGPARPVPPLRCRPVHRDLHRRVPEPLGGDEVGRRVPAGVPGLLLARRPGLPLLNRDLLRLLRHVPPMAEGRLHGIRLQLKKAPRSRSFLVRWIGRSRPPRPARRRRRGAPLRQHLGAHLPERLWVLRIDKGRRAAAGPQPRGGPRSPQHPLQLGQPRHHLLRGLTRHMAAHSLSENGFRTVEGCKCPLRRGGEPDGFGSPRSSSAPKARATSLGWN